MQAAAAANLEAAAATILHAASLCAAILHVYCMQVLGAADAGILLAILHAG